MDSLFYFLLSVVFFRNAGGTPYTSLLEQLELGEKVTNDYFFFQKNMKRMKEMLEGKTPATEKQKATIQKLWKKKFGEELEMNENITKKEVTTLFEIVNNM